MQYVCLKDLASDFVGGGGAMCFWQNCIYTEIKDPSGGSPGQSEVPSLEAWSRNIALYNVLCLLPGPPAY